MSTLRGDCQPGALSAEEANLLRARQLALARGWHDLVIGPMQGLRVLYDHTGRAVEWRRLVDELVPEFTDPATGGPQPGREQEWAMLTEYRVGIARDARDWAATQQLQDAHIAWNRQRAGDALDTLPGELDNRQLNQIRNLSVALFDLGQILRDQDDPGCVQLYTEAMQLCQRIGDRPGESAIASHLGHAYKNVPALRDLDQAEHWYQHDRELVEEHDTLRRARSIIQLGNIAYERFKDAEAAGASEEEPLGYLNDAAGAYYEALDLIPDDAADDLAVAHDALGNIYRLASQADQALAHHVKAIHYDERQDNRYRAGGNRVNAALTLADTGRRHDALLYARAALRDLEAVGPGAAALAGQARQLITALEQELAGGHDTSTSDVR